MTYLLVLFLLNRPVWAWPGRKNTWLCECHASFEHEYRPRSCRCRCFGKSHNVHRISLTYSSTVFSVLTENRVQIRVLNHLGHSVKLCKYWVNWYYYHFLFKLLSLYISENWPYRKYLHQVFLLCSSVSREFWWHWASLMSLGCFFFFFLFLHGFFFPAFPFLILLLLLLYRLRWHSLNILL